MSDAFSRRSAALAGRCRIERALGAGGLATAFPCATAVGDICDKKVPIQSVTIGNIRAVSRLA